MRPLLHSRWLRVTAQAIVVGAWAWLLHGQIVRLAALALSVSPGTIVLAVLGGVAYSVLSAISWVYVQRLLSGGPTWCLGVRAWSLTMVARYVPGNIWHVLARLRWDKRLGLSHTELLAGVVVEQVVTLLGAMVVVAVTLPHWGGDLSTQWIWLGLLPGGFVLLQPSILGRGVRWMATRLNRRAPIWRYSTGDVFRMSAAFALAMTMGGISLAIVSDSLVLQPLTGIPRVIGMFAFAWVLGYLSLVTPSGLGVREAILTGLLSTTMPLPEAMAASLLHRLTLTLGEAIVVFASAGSEYFQARRQVVERPP